MPQHSPRRVPRPGRPRRARRPQTFNATVLNATVLGAAVLVAVTLVAGCGGDSERPLPDARPPAVASLTPQQIVTEAQRALAQL